MLLSLFYRRGQYQEAQRKGKAGSEPLSLTYCVSVYKAQLSVRELIKMDDIKSPSSSSFQNSKSEQMQKQWVKNSQYNKEETGATWVVAKCKESTLAGEVDSGWQWWWSEHWMMIYNENQLSTVYQKKIMVLRGRDFAERHPVWREHCKMQR